MFTSVAHRAAVETVRRGAVAWRPSGTLRLHVAGVATTLCLPCPVPGPSAATVLATRVATMHHCRLASSTPSSHVGDDSTTSASAENGEGSGDDGQSLQAAYMEAERHIGDVQRSVSELYAQGRYGEALEAAEALVNMVRGHFGEKHPVYGSALNNLGVAKRAMHDFEGAVAAYKEASTVYEAVVGTTHPSFARVTHNLGVALKTLVERDPNTKGFEKLAVIDEAKAYLERALELQAEAGVDTEPNHGITMVNLAVVYRLEKNNERAEQLFKDALAFLAAHRRVGKEHPTYASALNALGVHYKLLNEFERAEPLYEEAIAVLHGALGAGHPSVVEAQHNLAELLTAMGQEDRATALRSDMLEQHEAWQAAADAAEGK